MRQKYTIELRVRDQFGDVDHRMAVYSEEFPIFSERFVDEMKAGFAFAGAVDPFGQVVTLMKQRQIRKEVLMQASKMLALRMADYIEDAEGWNGERRRETIKARD